MENNFVLLFFIELYVMWHSYRCFFNHIFKFDISLLYESFSSQLTSLATLFFINFIQNQCILNVL